MAQSSKLARIGIELKNHSPFTLAGAVLGILFMFLFQGLGQPGGLVMFKIFHPLHVVLSAMVTASLYKLRRGKTNVFVILLVGYVGSIGVATLSDCVIPWFGETVLGLDIPSHEQLDHPTPLAGASSETQGAGTESHNATVESHGATAKSHSAQTEHSHEHGAELHLGFIEEWYLVNPSALLGLLLAYFWPHTKVPHAAHILVSTWASAAHLMMNTAAPYSLSVMGEMLAVLFLAVWLPCCASDIVFPMLFIGGGHEHSHGSCWCGKEHKHES